MAKVEFMPIQEDVRIPAGKALLDGELAIPEGATGLVLFAHGSGSSRRSPRNKFVARELQAAGLATLLMDLLTESEETDDFGLRFDIPMLAQRLCSAIDWLVKNPTTADLRIGIFGASTGAAAALIAAAHRPMMVAAVVSRGGRPDLARDALPAALCPTLLIVGGNDETVIDLNEQALARLGSPTKSLVVVPGASHLFEEPGRLEEVARLATDWFACHLTSGGGPYAG